MQALIPNLERARKRICQIKKGFVSIMMLLHHVAVTAPFLFLAVDLCRHQWQYLTMLKAK